MAGLSQIYADGFARDLIPRSTAPTFLSSTSYAVGDYVYYQGSLYRCTTAHTGTWVASHFTAVTIGSELKAKEASLQSEIEDVKTDLSYLQISVANNFSTTTLYTKGEYCYYDGSLYVCTVDRHRGAWDATHFQYTKVGAELWYTNKTLTEEIEALEEDIAENYAKQDGYYEDLFVGSAEQLISTVTVEDKVPYQFRTSGGSADIGNRETDTIVGGTVAWNQLVKNGDFSSGTTNWLTSKGSAVVSNGVATFTANGTDGEHYIEQVISTLAGHKYLFVADMQPTDNASSWRMRIYYNGVSNYVSSICASTNWQTLSVVVGVTTASDVSRMRFITSTDHNGEAKIKNPQVYDLTQMFGSTIADYIYSLEQSTAGAGVAWFRKLFPLPYYAYNAGELKHVEGLASHDMTGFNQWDEEWESGAYNPTTGAKFASNNDIRSKNLIPVVPNTTYYIKSATPVIILGYDADKNLVAETLKYGNPNSTFVTQKNGVDCYYINFCTYGSTYGNTYKHDICINLHWDGERDGEYEAYVKHSYPLDDSLVLRGIPKLDSNNQLYYDGDVYASDGTVTRKYGIVDMGTLNWELFPNYTSIFRCALPTGMKTALNSQQAVLFNPKYIQTKGDSIATTEKGIAQLHQMYLVVNDSAYTSASDFKTAMSGVYLVYELATPTTEQAEPYTNPQIVDDFGTEEYVTDSIVPVGHETAYMSNLRAKVEMSPDSPSGDGDYIVRQSNGENTYVPLVIPTELPTAPSANGTYTLKATVSDGTVTYSWVSD